MCDMSSLYISQGILEATIKLSCSMYEQNIPIEVIAKAAGLTIPETEKLINENLSAQGG